MNTATAQLYETDFYGWIQRQAETLRARNFANLDLENLIEEIESMGRSERRELESRLEVLLMHLLKWVFQPERRGASWEATIEEQRKRVVDHLRENPSLKSKLPDIYRDTYDYAVLGAFKDTGLSKSTFPKQCPWTFEQVIDDTFWPETA